MGSIVTELFRAAWVRIVSAGILVVGWGVRQSAVRLQPAVACVWHPWAIQLSVPVSNLADASPL